MQDLMRRGVRAAVRRHLLGKAVSLAAIRGSCIRSSSSGCSETVRVAPTRHLSVEEHGELAEIGAPLQEQTTVVHAGYAEHERE